MSPRNTPASNLENTARSYIQTEVTHLPVPMYPLPESLEPLKMYQRIGLGRMQCLIRERICSNLQTRCGKDFGVLVRELRQLQHAQESLQALHIVSRPPRKRDIDAIISRTGRNYGIPLELQDRYHDIYGAMLRQAQEVREFDRQEWDGPEAYFRVFGYEPRGDVEYIAGGVSIYFRLRDEWDYAAAYHGLPEHSQLSAQNLKQVQQSAGAALRYRTGSPLLRNDVTLENNSRGRPFLGYNVETFEHEQQHVLNRFFWIFDLDPLPGQSSPRLPPAGQRLSQRTSCKLLREFYINLLAKDEIIAQRESLVTPDEVRQLLTDHVQYSSYDFVGKVREHLYGVGYLRSGVHARKSMFLETVTTPYRRLVSSIAPTLQRLTEQVADRHLLREILLTEPLGQWEALSRQIRA